MCGAPNRDASERLLDRRYARPDTELPVAPDPPENTT